MKKSELLERVRKVQRDLNDILDAVFDNKKRCDIIQLVQ